MAKMRYVNTKFWDDDYIVDLGPTEKLLFLYLITNPLTDICGAYETNIRRMSFDTGIDLEAVQATLSRFEIANKTIYRDGWVYVCNFIKNQSLNTKVKSGIELSMLRCPIWIRDRLQIDLDSLSKPTIYLNLNSNLNSNFKEEKTEPSVSLLSKPEQPQKPNPDKLQKLPDNYELTAEMRKYAIDRMPAAKVDEIFFDFTDFWWHMATKNNKRTIRGWLSTWQMRIRTLAETAAKVGTAKITGLAPPLATEDNPVNGATWGRSPDFPKIDRYVEPTH